MKNFYTLSLLLLITNCGNKLNNENSDCKYNFKDERIELCLPSDHWKSEKIGEYILFSNKLEDSIGINASLISITIKNYELNSSTEEFRNEYFDELTESSDLGVKLISKGKEEIDDKIFYDFEMIAANEQVYDYLMFYKKDKIGYILRATIPEKNRNDIGKSEYLNFFKSLRIK